MGEGQNLPVPAMSVRPTLAEQLTQQFYEWECRGRGWLLWDEPVDLEPPFRPIYYYLPQPHQFTDDGRQPTFLSTLVEGLFASNPKSMAVPAPQIGLPPPIEPGPYPVLYGEYVDEHRLLIPEDRSVSKNVALQLLVSLSSLPWPISFEIIGTSDTISYQLACRPSDSDLLLPQVRAHFPDAVTLPPSETLSDLWRAREDNTTLCVDFGLSNEFIRPLRTFGSLDPDPLLGVLATFDGLQEDELAVFQVLFQPCTFSWTANILRAVSDGRGGCFFADAPEMLALARSKISSPLFAVVIRLGVSAPSSSRAWDIARSVGGALRQFSDPASNELIPLTNDDYFDVDHVDDLLTRRSRRQGMILNAEELVGLVHPPAPSVRCANLIRVETSTKAPPTIQQDQGVVLGENIHHGKQTPVTLDNAQRIRHTYVIGASGTGKSTLLLNLIVQDLEQGNGLALLDPHGDLVDEVLLRIPDHRADDVIVFDPSDAEYPVGFNILSAHSELERDLMASDLVAVFRRQATSWGDQMTTVLANAVLAFLESKQGGTLADLRRFLLEKEYRNAFLKSVDDPSIVYYWQREFPLLSGRPHGSILTRLDAFLRPRLVRNIVCQQKNRLDFASMMNEGKVFLARLPQGAIGEANAHLLGTFLVSKFHQIALSRQEIREAERRPFFLYIDEFHNFVTPSMAAILTGARKYRLGLVLAHQELRQFEKQASEVAHAVLANPYARVCFRVGETDAKRLAEGFSSFSSSNLLNLGTGEALVRFEQARHDFNLRTYPASNPDLQARARMERVLDQSRERYATRREEVERTLADSLGQISKQPASTTVIEKTPPKVEPHEVPKEKLERPVLEKPAEPPPLPAARSLPKTKAMGKGGQEHRYLQQLIKRWAEGLGYRATIEKQLENGGSVDVFLEKDGETIACEISVTTTPEHEVQNVRKCLDTGTAQVFAIGSDARKLERVRKALNDTLPPAAVSKIQLCDPAEFLQHLQDREAKGASHETVVRGYRVNVNYQALPADEQRDRRGAISRVVLSALKRKGRDR
jgi:DNA helicase HerA-like ATPase